MRETLNQIAASSRRGFFRNAAAGLAAASAGGSAPAQTALRPLSEKEKLDRIASNTWPIRSIFKTRSTRTTPEVDALKKKYGEITMLDFPDFTKRTFPGVYRMDLFSGLFGDVADDSMFTSTAAPAAQAAGMGAAPAAAPQARGPREFDPSSAGGKKWLEKMANKMAVTGTKCHHISNNAPTNISDLDPEKRKAGIAVAKNWLDGAAMLGAQTMRVNSGGPRIAPSAVTTSDYPKNDELAKYLTNCIESFKEMADYGGKVGVKVTLENHWGLTANPINIQIVVEEVNSPYCEASPDFCNWEHEYLMYHGLEALVPYTHTTVHAKYWNRWKDPDVQRCVKIMTNGGFRGVFALEYEDGPWDGIEGAQRLFKEVLAAL